MDIINTIFSMFGERPIEITAVVLGLINVGLIVRRSVWNYPFGIIMVAIYAFIFYEAKLYSEVGLQVFFAVVQVYGLWHWLQKRDDGGRVIVERLAPKQYIPYGSFAVVAIPTLGMVMDKFTDASFAYLDATIAILSVIAQVMLARRRLENWIVWIIVDILAIGLYWAKGLQPTAFLYSIFLMMAVFGFFEWRRYLPQKNLEAT